MGWVNGGGPWGGGRGGVGAHHCHPAVAMIMSSELPAPCHVQGLCSKLQWSCLAHYLCNIRRRSSLALAAAMLIPAVQQVLCCLSSQVQSLMAKSVTMKSSRLLYRHHCQKDGIIGNHQGPGSRSRGLTEVLSGLVVVQLGPNCCRPSLVYHAFWLLGRLHTSMFLLCMLSV